MADKITGFVMELDGTEWVHLVDVGDVNRMFIETILKSYETDRDVESFPLVREKDEMETTVGKLYEDPNVVMDVLNGETLECVYKAARKEISKRKKAERLNHQLNNLFNEAQEDGIELYSALTGEVIDAFDVYLA